VGLEVNKLVLADIGGRYKKPHLLRLCTTTVLSRCLVVFLFGGNLRIKTPLFTAGNPVSKRAGSVKTQPKMKDSLIDRFVIFCCQRPNFPTKDLDYRVRCHNYTIISVGQNFSKEPEGAVNFANYPLSRSIGI
jgi:hypothetical protein